MRRQNTSRRKTLERQAKALRLHCLATDPALKVIDEAKLPKLAQAVGQWFAEQGADLDPIERVWCIKQLFDFGASASFIDAEALPPKHKGEWWLQLFGTEDILNKGLQPLGDHHWPPPLYYRVTDLMTSADADLRFGHFTSLFEVFLHLHCTAVTSQFLWMSKAVADQQASDLTLFGLKVVHATLSDRACGGGTTWLHRAAGLSCAGRALLDAGVDAPCGELFDLLDPAETQPTLDYDPANRGQLPVGKLSPRAEVLDFWQKFRNKEFGHIDVPTARPPKDQLRGAIRFTSLLHEFFGVYSHYRLAYIGVTNHDDYVIQGIWNEAGLYLGWTMANETKIEAIWGKAQNKLIVAPKPPELFTKPDCRSRPSPTRHRHAATNWITRIG